MRFKGSHAPSPAYCICNQGIGVCGAVIANAPPVVVLPPVLLGILHFGAVLREEHYLECKFGDAYLSYKQDVSRWP